MHTPWVLLHTTTGFYLAANEAGLSLRSTVNDDCLWSSEPAPREYRSLQGQIVPLADNGTLSAASERVPQVLREASFVVEPGPVKQPSSYLEELRTHGYTVVDGILSDSAREALKRQIAAYRATHYPDETATDGHFWMTSGISWSAEIARAATHPLALWLLQQYLHSDALHYCHQPIVTTLKPARAMQGTFPADGWHSDYPYHPGVFPDDVWPAEPVYGAQYNVCVDEFSAAAGATQFLPGSHLERQGPPATFNATGTRMGEGQHADVQQMIAPAGAALIYDARTWHRGAHELNVSGRDRIALLNAVAPAWIQPMLDKDWLQVRYRESAVPAALNQRERDTLHQLCFRETQPAPPGAPSLKARRLPR